MEKRINTSIITDYMKANKMSKSAFCKACKIGHTTFDKIMNQNLNIGITKLFKIGRVINASIIDFLVF